MNEYLKPGERIDDLQRNGYGIIQNPEKFCFGMDAVLLSGFAQVKKGARVIDLGTGTGIIPILLSAKTEGREFYGMEIQEESYDMAKRSVAMNHLEDRVHIIQGDLCQASSTMGKAQFDVVTCNPPYMNQNHGLKNPGDAKAIARHEILCTLEDVIRESCLLLKPGGHLFMVHRPHRLAEIFECMHRYHMEPKRMKMVHPYVSEDANMVLIEAVRGGNSWMKVEAPLIVYKEPGVYMDEIYEIYGY